MLSVLDGGGAPRRLQRLSSYRKKFVVFAVELHCAAFPTIPLFPLSLELLMEFCVWASRNGVNGFDSISNYVGDVVTWAMQTCDQPDPRSATPLAARTWATFVSNFPKVVGAPPSKVKLRL